MKKIMEIQMGGFTIPVYVKKLKNDDGAYHPGKQIIFINRNLTPSMARLTFLHEFLHAILHIHCESLFDTLKDMKSKEQMEEQLVVSLALPLLESLRKNVEFTTHLLED